MPHGSASSSSTNPANSTTGDGGANSDSDNNFWDPNAETWPANCLLDELDSDEFEDDAATFPPPPPPSPGSDRNGEVEASFPPVREPASELVVRIDAPTVHFPLPEDDPEEARGEGEGTEGTGRRRRRRTRGLFYVRVRDPALPEWQSLLLPAARADVQRILQEHGEGLVYRRWEEGDGSAGE
ncbi:hypothetical protein MKZ38_001771 [Zalerion maritima]|uniref:Uncharacterized protein n=1 Tax=Zalerion maritima TaxID=339359 RepID=A0AAD5S5D5_9PEZI|nr:hypothetical protein MKZ38_001771 [Zalerion maritima]